jgi:hypothetical protein
MALFHAAAGPSFEEIHKTVKDMWQRLYPVQCTQEIWMKIFIRRE